MVDDQLSRVFAALADPTRRDMVARLAVGDATVSELAAPYDVSVQAPGFGKITKTDVLIELNKTTVSNFALEISTVGAEVQVTGETPLIETTTGEIKHSLDEQRIEATPLAGRNFISLVEQIPGFQNAPWIGSSTWRWPKPPHSSFSLAN